MLLVLSRVLIAVTLSLSLLLPIESFAHSSDSHHHSMDSSSSSHRSGDSSSHSRATPGVARDTHGRLTRSAAAKAAFKKSHPCPSTGKSRGACPGYVIDHVKPLKRGGRDAPDNMQWQTVQEAKIKDRTE
jgi:hypothetical protein